MSSLRPSLFRSSVGTAQCASALAWAWRGWLQAGSTAWQHFRRLPLRPHRGRPPAFQLQLGEVPCEALKTKRPQQGGCWGLLGVCSGFRGLVYRSQEPTPL